MKLHPGHLLPVIAALLLPGCSGPETQRAEYFVFGTLVEVSLPGAHPDESEALFADLQQEFQRMHREWHAWEPGELVRINSELQTSGASLATAELADLLRRAQDLERRSGGRFNPAIGKLVALWGFHTSDFPVLGPPPPRADIEALVAMKPSTLDIATDGRRLHCANPAVQLDFGGIAKGFAVDLAIERIRGAGLKTAMVNAGGDMRMAGVPEGRPWRIAVRDPGGGIAGRIEITGDAAVFTSGNYQRFRQDADRRYAHILDPRTGWPVPHVASATVIGTEGVSADAAATALAVAGPDDWPRVARDMGVEAALVIDDEGLMTATAAMMAYFTPERGREVVVVEYPGE